MANQNSDTRPITEVFGGLARDITGLFRKEIDLAKTEAAEKMSRAMSGIMLLAIGLVFAIGAVGVFLSALVTGLSALLVAQGFSDTNASALAAVIVGVVVALIAWLMVSRGLAALKASTLTLERTTTSLRRDAGIIKERI